MCTACTSPNGRDILAAEGRPHVDVDAPTLRYADVFPGRVDPLDDPTYRAAYLAMRRTEDRPPKTDYPLPRAA